MDLNSLLQPEVQKFISESVSINLPEFLLSKSPFPNISVQELAQQIKGRRIAEKKFPFLNREGIIFPPSLNLEQSSSEATARYKSTLFSGEKLVDLTAGFGIDSYWMGRNFEKVFLVESNDVLLEIIKHNYNIINENNNVYLNKNLYTFLEENEEKFSLIYLDPSRRDKAQRKKFLLEDLSPNILEIQVQLFEFTNTVAVKLSPLMDLSVLHQNLKYLKEIHIVAVKNEVKELLVILEKDFAEEVKIKCINLQSEDSDVEFSFSEAQKAEVHYGEPENYLYIPNHSLLKSGAFNLISEKFHLKKLHPNTHLYTSSEKKSDFPGRILNVNKINSKEIEKGVHFNIISKNYPLTPEQIKKKYKIKDGGKDYLIFTQTLGGKVILKSI